MPQTLIAKITSRDPKGLHTVIFFGAKIELDDIYVQRLNEHSGELQDGIAKLILGLVRHEQYPGEEVRSSCRYPEEYKGPKPIADQIRAIAEIFDLDPSQALEFTKNLPVLPERAEGWFAIPSVDALAAKYFPEVIDPAQKYCQAVQLVHSKIAASRPFHSYRIKITPAQLRVHARTANALDLIAETQKGDILIVAAQLGMRHRGRSVHLTREVLMANEFVLGSVAVGSIILTHPERLVRWEELEMNCAGDEQTWRGGNDYSWGMPYFHFSDGEVKFDTCGVGCACEYYGSVSAFLPQ